MEGSDGCHRGLRRGLLLPVFISIAFGWLFSLALSISSGQMQPLWLSMELSIPSIDPLQGLGSPAHYLGALFFVSIMFVSSLVVTLLVKKRKDVVRLVGLAFFWMASFATTYFFISEVSKGIPLDALLNMMYVPAAAFVATVSSYLSYKGKGMAAVISSGYVGSVAGTVFGAYVPYWTVVILLAFAAAYDAFAVLKGHLARMDEQDVLALGCFTVEHEGLIIGLGDIFFYSLLLSSSIFGMGLSSGLAATAGILVGFLITVRLLNLRQSMPGLPIPIAAGLSLAIAVSMLLRT